MKFGVHGIGAQSGAILTAAIRAEKSTFPRPDKHNTTRRRARVLFYTIVMNVSRAGGSKFGGVQLFSTSSVRAISM